VLAKISPKLEVAENFSNVGGNAPYSPHLCDLDHTAVDSSQQSIQTMGIVTVVALSEGSTR